MAVKIQLCNLVDLALCDPEIGAVNFNHLRTLLHAMLKLTNHNYTFIEPKSFTEIDSVAVGKEYSTIDPSLLPEIKQNVSTEPFLDQMQIDGGHDGLSEENENDEEKTKKLMMEYNNRLMLNERNFENRICNLEKTFLSNDEFPTNKEILNENEKNNQSEESNASPEDIEGYKELKSNNKLGTVWQNKKIRKRLEATEEAIDKLFSIMNDVLVQNKFNDETDLSKSNNETDLSKSNYESDLARFESIENQLRDLQNGLDQCMENAKNYNDNNSSEENIQSNKSRIEDCNLKVENLSKIVHQNSSNLEQNTANLEQNTANLEQNAANLQQNTAKIDNNCRIIEQLERQIKDYLKHENKVIEVPTVNTGVERIELLVDGKSNLFDLQKKVDNTILELDKKANIVDVDDLRDKITQLTEEIARIQGELPNKVNISDLNKLQQELLNKADVSDLNRELLNKANTPDLDTSSSEIANELNEIQNKIQDILSQIEDNKNAQFEMASKIEDLISTQNKMLSAQNEKSGLDTSVVAAIQHLAQENRHQITALHANMAILQKLQMPIQTMVSNDNDADNHQNFEMVEILQNHILTLQEEQVRQSGHISNMVDDYKEEFNRKQLHIDALYDYIEKLQHIKADKEDINIEMNIKADKQSLDNKVNMSTFDERYQMLEQSLQDALSRLDQYVQDEALLKDAFGKLSEDMNSKLDSDAEKKLKKFLDERLKAIQVSRTHLPCENVTYARNAAGMRRPMPLVYNCISCDRPVDITVRGVMAPVPMNMPAKKVFAPSKFNKEDQNLSTKKNSSYNAMVVNRSCGGSHTSVNINMLRMIKLDPYQEFLDSNNNTQKVSVDDDVSISDCVVGKDGQIYRGRFKVNEIPKQTQSDKFGKKTKKSRTTHSATTPSRQSHCVHNSDRSYSAHCFENESGNKSRPLPPISPDYNVARDDHLGHSSISPKDINILL